MQAQMKMASWLITRKSQLVDCGKKVVRLNTAVVVMIIYCFPPLPSYGICYRLNELKTFSVSWHESFMNTTEFYNVLRRKAEWIIMCQFTIFKKILEWRTYFNVFKYLIGKNRDKFENFWDFRTADIFRYSWFCFFNQKK